jgi:antitoxin component of MazEF toxin-antitoxin module
MPTATLRNLGGLIAIALPKKLLSSFGLVSGSEVDITVKDGSVIISPLKRKYTLEEMIAGMEIGDLPSDADWENAPVAGKEVL